MEELLTRVWEDLSARLSGPMQFRLLLQPGMAVLFAIRAGLNDAREKRPAYLWSIFSNPLDRKESLAEGWKAVGKIFVVAILMDAVYQLMTLRWFYPGEALIVAIVLAIVPYLLIRGPVNRLARLIQRSASLPPVIRKEK